MQKGKRKRSAWDKDKFEDNGEWIKEQDKEQDKDKAGGIVIIPELEAEGEQDRVDGRTQDGVRQTRHGELETVEKVAEALKKAHG